MYRRILTPSIIFIHFKHDIKNVIDFNILSMSELGAVYSKSMYSTLCTEES